MANVLLEKNPVAAPESDRQEINRLEDLFEKIAKEGVQHVISRKARLVGPNDEVIELPDTVFNLLRQVVFYLSEGKAISLIPVNKELTTQEAADLLNVSRPFLIKLLDQGELNYRYVGKHRRIRVDDLIEYRQNRDAYRSHAIEEMIKISEEAGLYDKDIGFVK
jgi:excisionase family DNA binding protein